MKLQYKIAVFMTIILVVVIGGLGFLTIQQIEDTVESGMGNAAMDVAITISSMDIIKETLGTTKDTAVIQETIEKFREKTRFQYIIVLDMDAIQYSYPYEKGLGSRYKGGGEEKVLETGEAYISSFKNPLFSNIRAFVPVHYKGKQVGAVKVAILTDRVYEEVQSYNNNIYRSLFIALLIGIGAAMLLAFNIKKTIFGLEPKEIALLLGQRDIILHNFKNGILAVDQHSQIIFVNKPAKEILGLDDEDMGKSILDFAEDFTDKIHDVLINEESLYNHEIKIAPGNILHCSFNLLRNHRNDIIGVVCSFQDLTEVKRMAEELTGIKKLTSALRAQNHEFLNKLHTILGLIQLEEYNKAVDYIALISNEKKKISGVLNSRIKDAHVSGLLLAKYHKASEAKINLEVDPDSSLEEITNTNITADEVCSILGNLIENAIDELVKMEGGKIAVKINSTPEGLEIRVQDNGPGISGDIRERIFEGGVTTKLGNRGYGMRIVKKIIDSTGGSIRLLQNGGTIWELFIPAERGESND